MEETGWKLVHGDVFRPPRYPKLFAAVIGSGIQIFLMTFITICRLLSFFFSFYSFTDNLKSTDWFCIVWWNIYFSCIVKYCNRLLNNILKRDCVWWNVMLIKSSHHYNVEKWIICIVKDVCKLSSSLVS